MSNSCTCRVLIQVDTIMNMIAYGQNSTYGELQSSDLDQTVLVYLRRE